MRIDFDDMNPPAWFDVPDDPDGAKVLVRICAGEDIEKINKQTTKKQPPEYRGGRRYEVPPKIDEDANKELLWDFIIVDWAGISDADGRELPCTKENKIKLMSKSFFFARFVGECLEQLVEDNSELRQLSEKN